MNNVLSGISGYFSKSLILGTFLPVVLSVILGWLLLIPLLPPADWPALKSLEALDTQWKVLAVSLLAVVLTGFLYNVNIPLIRVYEGYPWKDLWVGRRRTRKYRRLFRIASAQWKGIAHLIVDLREANPKDPRLKLLRPIKDAAGRELHTSFPGSEDLLLPTRLGNVIRSFEYYPQSQYGIEAVTVWPRLVAKIDKDYAAGVGDAKTSFDFMLNCSFLSTVLGFALLVTGLLYPAHFNSPGRSIVWLSEFVTLWACAFFFYFMAISRAAAWGNMVRGAFDLYRLELLRQLGYQRMPATLREERELWKNISQRMAFGEYHGLPAVEYESQTPSASAEPPTVALELWRGVNPTPATAGPPPAARSMAIEIRVRNVGRDAASKVFVTDKLPDGFAYKWGSLKAVTRAKNDAGVLMEAEVVADALAVSGANPYRFGLGPLAAQAEMVLTYEALSLAAGAEPAGDGGAAAETPPLVFQGYLLAFRQDGDAPAEDNRRPAPAVGELETRNAGGPGPSAT